MPNNNRNCPRSGSQQNSSYKRLMLLVCVTLCMLARSQNLVPNPGFELANCPTGYTGFPAQVASFFQNWYSANCASPDPMTNCSSHVNTSIPGVWFGAQYAHAGTNYIGVSFYNGWYEYIGVQLTQALTAGDAYQVSFYVSCADQVRYASDALGIYFSTTQVKCLSGFSGPVLSYTPQVIQAAGVFLTDTIGWIRISGTYVATGGEQYIVLGCFKPWNTATLYDVDPSYVNGRCYYYVDDVSVEKMVVLPVGDLAFDAALSNDHIDLSWQSDRENSCEYELEKSSDALHFETLTKVDARAKIRKPFYYSDPTPFAGITYYRLRQTDCRGNHAYSKTISVSYNKEEIRTYPNPVAGALTLELGEEPVFPVRVSLSDISGNILFETETREATLHIPFDTYDPGVYILAVQLKEKQILYKKIIRQ